MFFCAECGTKNENGTQFCSSCGKKINEANGGANVSKLTQKKKWLIMLGSAFVLLILAFNLNNSAHPIVGTWETSTSHDWRTRVTLNEDGTASSHQINVNTEATRNHERFEWEIGVTTDVGNDVFANFHDIIRATGQTGGSLYGVVSPIYTNDHGFDVLYIRMLGNMFHESFHRID